MYEANVYRFAALLWNRHEQAAAEAADRLRHRLERELPGMEPVISNNGMYVAHIRHHHGACRAYPLAFGTGVILGQLFLRTANAFYQPAKDVFGNEEARLIEESAGRHIVDHYWGRYVLILSFGNGERHGVLRDPTGALACFYRDMGAVRAVFSDMEICNALGVTDLSVNWNHMAAFLVNDRLLTDHTGLREVSQVYPGEFVEFLPAATRRDFYWDPLRIYTLGQVGELEEARNALRDTVRATVRCWGESYRTIVHEVSGGLDSSIVAACLGRLRDRTEALCLNFFTDASESDERKYARLAAEAAGLELLEVRWDGLDIPLLQQLDRSLLATPAQLQFLSGADRFREQLISEHNVEAVFSGRGGDHLFVQGRNTLGPSEFVSHFGLRPRLSGLIKDAARLSGQSVWKVTQTTASYGLLRKRYNPYSSYKAPSILNRDVHAALPAAYFWHPWIEMCREMPAGKVRHAFMITDCLFFYMSPCPCAEPVHPLISQPILECCLRIPSYMLTSGGRDRALIREGFSDELPRQIVNRHSKGGTTAYFSSILTRNQHFLRDFLLDGTLVRHHIVDRRHLETALTEAELIRGESLISVLATLRAEAWLDTWTSALPSGGKST